MDTSNKMPTHITSTVDDTVYIQADKPKDLPKFDGSYGKWLSWWDMVRTLFGHQQWYHVLEKPLSETLTSKEKQINSTIYYYLGASTETG